MSIKIKSYISCSRSLGRVFCLGKALLGLVLFSFFSQANAECTSKELVHGWGGDWVPFVMGTPSEPQGLDMDILDAVVKKAGCRWRNTDHAIPWARHLKLVESGDVDLATSASWTEERAKYANFTHPYRTEYVALYVLKENFDKYKDVELERLVDLDFKLGVIRGEVHGASYGRFVSRLGENVSLVENNGQNLQKLLRKRIDGYIGHTPHDSIFLGEQKAQNDVVILPKTVKSTGDVHIMMSKKSTNQEDLEALNNAIVALTKDGTIRAIKDKYSEIFNAEFY